MEELSPKIRRSIRKYLPIETEGLTLHPILVREWDEFNDAKPAIACIQQALPVRLASMPLLSAYYLMEYEALKNGGPAVGLFYRAILFLAMSLRIGEGLAPEKRVRMFQPIVDSKDHSKLRQLRFVVNGQEMCEITSVQFQRLRPILAAQNGIELVDEDANPDLIEAERDLAAQKGPKLNLRSEDLMATISALSGTDPASMEEWPVLKLMERERAFQRVFGYLICGVGEAMGTQFKKGNPYPSLFYERVREGSDALTPLDSFAGGEGTKAVARSIGVSGGAETPQK